MGAPARNRYLSSILEAHLDCGHRPSARNKFLSWPFPSQRDFHQPLPRRISMTKFMSTLLATTLSVSFALAAAVPVNAAPVVPSVTAPTASSEVQQVQDRRMFRRHIIRRDFRRGGDFRRGNVLGPRRGGDYWNGHRGYRYHRPGYRRHGDLWFPLAAFATGVIISGAIANDRPPAYRGGSAHVQWCYDRYRSYRASDNTFQPYNGPRQQCYSPY